MKTKLISLGLVLALVFIGGSSFAQDGSWGQRHPRRAEVNQRLENQHDRIDRKVDDGKMSRGEARKIRHEDHQVRQEERDMASQNHGHITRQEQRTLNHQENRISRQIRRH
jgi:hypothetical protein